MQKVGKKGQKHVRYIKYEIERVLIKDFEKFMNEENEWTGICNNVHVNTGLVNKISIDKVRTPARSLKKGKALETNGILI